MQEEILLKNPKLYKTPIVRNGKQATVGFQPEIWKDWQRIPKDIREKLLGKFIVAIVRVLLG